MCDTGGCLSGLTQSDAAAVKRKSSRAERAEFFFINPSL